MTLRNSFFKLLYVFDGIQLLLIPLPTTTTLFLSGLIYVMISQWVPSKISNTTYVYFAYAGSSVNSSRRNEIQSHFFYKSVSQDQRIYMDLFLKYLLLIRHLFRGGQHFLRKVCGVLLFFSTYLCKVVNQRKE